MIKYKIGDITNAEEHIICHQVNCQGKMNSGVAKAIREKWPEAYNKYIDMYYSREDWPPPKTKDYFLGVAQGVRTKGKIIVNMFAQASYGYDNKQYTSYDAFIKCLNHIKSNCDPQSEIITIAFPYKIGCVRGGASWPIIQKMIETEMKDYNITFYCINPDEIDEEDKEKFKNA